MKYFWSILIKILTFVLTCYCGIAVILNCGLWSILVGIIMILSFPLSTLLHELGHMLFGATVKIKAEPSSASFSAFVKETFLEWWGASSCKIVPRTDKNLKGRIIFTASGGLAVNLIFIILGIIALCVPAVTTGLCAMLPASFHLLALNALPCEFDGGKTDGEIIYGLIKNDDSSKVMLAVLAVQAQVLGGKPIEEVEESLLFSLPQIQEDDMNFIALTQLRYEYFKARGNEPQAEKYRLRLKDLQQYLPQ